MRLLAGILAGQDFDTVLTGDHSLQKRPMKRIVEPLTSMGVSVRAEDGMPPLSIVGGKRLRGIRYLLPVASAQIKSCILLAGLFASGRTQIIETSPTRDHTERMLKWFGVNVSIERTELEIETFIDGNSELTAADVDVPSDISSAAFFIVAAACLPGSELSLMNVGLNPTRSAIIDVLRDFGAKIKTSNVRDVSGETVGDVVVTGCLDGGASDQVLRGGIIAALIDEIPVLAILGTKLEGGLEVRDAAELRVKESDRIMAVVENLRRMSADVEEFPDGFRVGPSNLRGAPVDSFGDHRIAMAFAVAGLLAEGTTHIRGAKCADVSFPGFFDQLKAVVN